MRTHMMAAATLFFCITGSPASQAAPIGPIADQGALKTDLGGIEKTQYFFGGRQYCWYPAGWHGPGWYWCGYAFRRGFGWGGGFGWHGWGRPGFGPRPGFRYRGGPRGRYHR